MNHEKLGLGDKEISFLPECHFALQHICYTIFVQEDEDGKPYKCKHAFNCPSQLKEFKYLLEKMATRSEEYITLDGRVTNNVQKQKN